MGFSHQIFLLVLLPLGLGRDLLQANSRRADTAPVVNSCDEVKWEQKLAVVAGTKHSHRWLDELELPTLIYQHEDAEQPHYYPNYALEAYAYLQFFWQYYDCLPEATALLHGHVASWHSHHMNETLTELEWEHVPGYADLNRKQDIWKRPLKALGSHPDYPLASGTDAYNGSFAPGQVVAGVAYPKWEVYVWRQRQAAQQFFDECLGPLGVGAMPDFTSFHCCTQIVVTREQVHKRSRDFYRSIMLWLQDNTVQGIHVYANYDKARVLADAVDVFWPIILGVNESQMTPECDIYGDGSKPRCQSSSRTHPSHSSVRKAHRRTNT